MMRHLRLLVIAVALFIPAHSVSAQHAPVSDLAGWLQAAWFDCGADRRKFCDHVRPGGGRVVRCLMDNVDRASAKCRIHIHRAIALDSTWTACRPDIANYCSAVLPGRGRILSCLAGNKDRLSPACLDGIDDAKSVLKY